MVGLTHAYTDQSTQKTLELIPVSSVNIPARGRFKVIIFSQIYSALSVYVKSDCYVVTSRESCKIVLKKKG